MGGRELGPACEAQGARPYAEEVGWADQKSDGVSASPSAPRGASQECETANNAWSGRAVGRATYQGWYQDSCFESPLGDQSMGQGV